MQVNIFFLDAKQLNIQMQIQKQFKDAASIRKNFNACLSRLFYFFKQKAKYVERSYEESRECISTK